MNTMHVERSLERVQTLTTLDVHSFDSHILSIVWTDKESIIIVFTCLVQLMRERSENLDTFVVLY